MNDSNGRSIHTFLVGHSKLELQLAAYIVLLFIVACGLFLYTDLRATLPTTKHSETTINRPKSAAKPTQRPDPIPTAYEKKTFNGHGFQVALTFDPNAYARTTYTPNKTTSNGTLILGDNEVDITGRLIASPNEVNIGVVDDYSSPE
jgi:hypothetical protein